MTDIAGHRVGGIADWSLSCGIVDKDVEPPELISGLAHILRRISITEIATEHHRPYNSSFISTATVAIAI